MAAILSAVMVFTSVDMGWAITSKAQEPSNALTITDAGLIANNYGDEEGVLSEKEVAILNSGLLNSKEYSIEQPTATDESILVDSDNNVIYANHVKKGEYTWVAETANILVGENVLSTVTLAGSETKYDVEASFSCEEQGYTVRVNYNLYIEVEDKEQDRLINIPFYLSDSIDNMEDIDAARSYYDVIITLYPTIKASYDSYIAQLPFFTPSSDLVNILNSWGNQYTQNGGKSTLSVLMTGENGYSNGSVRKVENLFERQAEYYQEAKKIYQEASWVIENETFFNSLNSSAVTMMKLIVSSLEKPVNSSWDIIAINTEKTVLKSDISEYGTFDATVKAAIENSQKHVTDYVEPENTEALVLKDKLLAGTVGITSSVNRKYVTVVVKANVISSATNKLVTLTTGENSAVFDMNDGTLASEVETMISSKVDPVVKEWNYDGYNIGSENYDSITKYYDVEGQEITNFETLNQDITCVVEYTAKEYTVTYQGKDVILDSTKAYYKEKIQLPSAGEGSYEFIIDGTVYQQGEAYLVEKDVTATVMAGNVQEGIEFNDVVVNNHEVSEQEADILKNDAVSDRTILIRTIDASLLNLTDGVITANSYSAGAGKGTWIPATAYVLNGATVKETLTIKDGKATITLPVGSYTSVKVEYKLAIPEETDGETLETLQLPGILVTEAKQQLNDMSSVVNTWTNYSQYLGLLNKGTLGYAQTQMKEQENIDALSAMLISCFPIEETETELILTGIINNYIAVTDKDENGVEDEQLAYYYQNQVKLKAQLEALAKNLDILIDIEEVNGEEKATGEFVNFVVATAADSSIAESLLKMKNNLSELSERFDAKNANMDDTHNDYASLLDAIVVAKNTTGAIGSYTSANDLYHTASVSVEAEGTATVKIVVGKDNGKSVEGSLTFSVESALEQEDIDAINELIANLITQIGINANNNKYYEVDVTGKIPTVGETLTEECTITYTYSPKEYVVVVADKEVQITYESLSVVLPGHTSSNYVYYYTIGSEEVQVGTVDTKYDFTSKQLDTLFVEGRFVITRREENVRLAKVEELVTDLNQTLVDKRLDDVVSFVPYISDETITIVLRINPLANTDELTSAITEIAMQLMGYSYVQIGDEAFIETTSDAGTKISINALVNAILNSGFGTKRLINAINEDGTVNNNSVSVKGTIITNAVKGIATPDKLGGFLMETEFAITRGGQMPFIVTLQDYGQNTSELQSLRNTVATVEQYATIECTDGVVQTTLRVPEKAYELYMAAMLLQGEMNLATFEEPTFEEMMAYMDELIITPLVKEGDKEGEADDVTANTILNTLKELNVEADLSGYADTINSILKYARALLDGSLENGEIASVKENDNYNYQASCPAEKLAQVASLPSEIAGALSGEIVVPINVELTNVVNDYTALVVDVNAEGIQNKADFTTAKDVVTTNANTVVVLLNNVDSITVNGTTYVDLNGKTVGTLNANASVTVFDSTLDTSKAGTIETISGQENVSITAGVYENDVTSMLPDGYVWEDKEVSNRFYTLIKDDKGNVTIEIAADFLKLEDPVAWKKVAMEMAVDVALNAYSWADTSISGNSIYSIEVLDLIAAYKGGASNLVSDLVEQINCDGMEAFANDLITKLTDFGTISTAITNNVAFAEYKLVTKPWKLEVLKATAGDYITANIVAGDENPERTITIKVANEEEKKDLVALCDELKNVFKALEIKLNLDDLSYDENSGFNYEAGANITATADLSKKEYVAVIGIIMANGMEDPSAMVAAVNKYLEKGVTTDIVAAIEDLTSAQIIASLNKANGVAFADMMTKLGIKDVNGKAAELEKIYEDVLNICYKLVNASGFTGGEQTLEAFGTGEFGTYNVTKENWHRMNINLTLILAEKVEEKPEPPIVEAPVISAPIVKGNSSVNAVKVEENYIYIDVKADGIKHDDFLKDITFEATNDGEITYKFSDEAIGLVQTGETLTITATNKGGTDVETYTIIVLGDVNSDGQVQPNDATIILKNCVGNVGNTINFATVDCAKRAAMINTTEGVDPGDATIVLKKTVGKSYTTWLN